MNLVLGLATAAATRAIWRNAWSWPQMPTHTMTGALPWIDRIPVALIGGAALLKWGAVVAVVGTAPTVQHAAMDAAVFLIGAFVMRRLLARPHSCAEPVAHDAAWLGLAAVLAWSAVGGLAPLVGLGAGVAVGIGFIALQWLFWGVVPSFFVHWRPNFRIHADNPDSMGMSSRLRVPGDLTLEIVDDGASFNSLTIIRPLHGRAAAIDSAALIPVLREKGRATIRLGEASDGDGVDFVVPLEAGRYFLTVRPYEVAPGRHELPRWSRP